MSKSLFCQWFPTALYLLVLVSFFCRVMIGKRLCREQYLFLKLREGDSGFKQDGKGLERYGMVKEAKDGEDYGCLRIDGENQGCTAVGDGRA